MDIIKDIVENEKIKKAPESEINYYFEKHVVQSIDTDLENQVKEFQNANINVKFCKPEFQHVTYNDLLKTFVNFEESKADITKKYSDIKGTLLISTDDTNKILHQIGTFENFIETEYDYLRFIYVEEDVEKEVELKLKDNDSEMILKTPCILHVEVTLDGSKDSCKKKLSQIYKQLFILKNASILLFNPEMDNIYNYLRKDKIKIYSKLIVSSDDTTALQDFNNYSILQDKRIIDYFCLPKSLQPASKCLRNLENKENDHISYRIRNDFYIQHGHVLCPFSLVEMSKKLIQSIKDWKN